VPTLVVEKHTIRALTLLLYQGCDQVGPTLKSLSVRASHHSRVSVLRSHSSLMVRVRSVAKLGRFAIPALPSRHSTCHADEHHLRSATSVLSCGTCMYDGYLQAISEVTVGPEAVQEKGRRSRS
jgi:hypothetical protein